MCQRQELHLRSIDNVAIKSILTRSGKLFGLLGDILDNLRMLTTL